MGTFPIVYVIGKYVMLAFVIGISVLGPIAMIASTIYHFCDGGD